MISATPRVFIVIAAYNEGQAIAQVVGGLLPVYSDIVVVDDGSIDDTARAALAAGATVLQHPVNLGQGAALQTGIDHALHQGAGYVVTFDADGQHSPADVQALLTAMAAADADVALGSRFLGRAIGLDKKRRLLLRVAVLFTNMTTGARLTDAHNGLRVFSRRAAELIRIRQNRMAHASEIIEQIVRHELRIVEVPVTITYSVYSRAKGQKLANSIGIVLDLLIGKLHR